MHDAVGERLKVIIVLYFDVSADVGQVAKRRQRIQIIVGERTPPRILLDREVAAYELEIIEALQRVESKLLDGNCAADALEIR